MILDGEGCFVTASCAVGAMVPASSVVLFSLSLSLIRASFAEAEVEVEVEEGKPEEGESE